MSEETIDSNAPSNSGERPTFLTVVCILSFIGIGFGIIGYIGAFALLGAAEAAAGGMEDAITQAGGTVTNAPGTGVIWAYIIIGLIATIVALIGVIKMWKLQKQGFMLYTGAQVVAVIMTIVFAGFAGSIMSIVFAGAFIAMYYVNLKHMS